MSVSDFFFVLSGPLLVLVAMAITAWLANWQDLREDRRRAGRSVPGE